MQQIEVPPPLRILRPSYGPGMEKLRRVQQDWSVDDQGATIRGHRWDSRSLVGYLNKQDFLFFLLRRCSAVPYFGGERVHKWWSRQPCTMHNVRFDENGIKSGFSNDRLCTMLNITDIGSFFMSFISSSLSTSFAFQSSKLTSSFI